MPRVVVTPFAVRGLERCRRFLHERDPESAGRAAQLISTAFRKLEATPEIGRPFGGRPEWRELIIPFGGAGYTALYRFVSGEESVVVLAFKHQREAGFPTSLDESE